MMSQADLQRVISRCLRKRPEDRYQGTQQFVDALKNVQHEIESGVSMKVPLAERIRDGIQSIREFTPKQWGWTVVATAAAVAFFYFILHLIQDMRFEYIKYLLFCHSFTSNYFLT